MMSLYEKTRILAVTLATEYDDPLGKMSTEEWERAIRERELEIEGDPYEVGVLYCTFEDEDENGHPLAGNEHEHDIQGYFDIVNMTMRIEVDWNELPTVWTIDESDLEFDYDYLYSEAVSRARETT